MGLWDQNAVFYIEENQSRFIVKWKKQWEEISLIVCWNRQKTIHILSINSWNKICTRCVVTYIFVLICFLIRQFCSFFQLPHVEKLSQLFYPSYFLQNRLRSSEYFETPSYLLGKVLSHYKTCTIDSFQIMWRSYAFDTWKSRRKINWQIFEICAFTRQFSFYASYHKFHYRSL